MQAVNFLAGIRWADESVAKRQGVSALTAILEETAIPGKATVHEKDPEADALNALDRDELEGVLGILMRAYGASLYRYCRQMVNDPDLADDVHQMTFVQAFEGLGKFARRSSFRTWLFSIARNRCLDALKMTRRRRRRFQEVEELPEKPVDQSGPEEQLLADASTTVLENCLRQLQPRIRTAVLLRYRDGFSYPQMTRICGEKAATLQARVARALPVLRRCVEERGLSL